MGLVAMGTSVIECSLARGDRAGRCSWDGRPLKGRQRRWCRRACSDAFNVAHNWTSARDEAKRRDRFTCRRCGHWEREPDAWARFLLWYCYTAGLLTEDQCRRLEFWDLNLTTVGARRGWAIEVNHIQPRLGAGYGFGCWNHPENLESLCHDCHLLATKAQKRGWRRPATELPEDGFVQLDIGTIVPA